MIEELRFRLVGKRRAQALAPDEYHDVILLRSLGIIRLTAHGGSITEIGVDLLNRLDRRLKLVIPVGACFAAKGTHQDMVTTKEVALRIGPLGTRFMAVAVACMNAHREIPTKTDRFGGVRLADDRVVRFIRAASLETPMTIQAGVWALTDGLDRAQLRQRLISEAASGRVRQSIRSADIECAGMILRRLDIKTPISN